MERERTGAFHRKGAWILEGSFLRKWRLWLVCGHPGGEARGGDRVVKRRCYSCGGKDKYVDHVEPVCG